MDTRVKSRASICEQRFLMEGKNSID